MVRSGAGDGVMPWKETRVMHERMRFIVEAEAEEEPFAELCQRFGISRKTGYKWIARYNAQGPGGLEDRSPIARSHPRAVSEEMITLLVEARKAHPFWGPKKLRAWLAAERGEQGVPAASTVGELLKRHGLIQPRRRRVRVPVVGGRRLGSCDESNSTWCADFKGHFVLGDRSRCYPLTISDGFSRYLLKCEALGEPKTQPVREHFERAFRAYGMPQRIRTDNGPPFASVGLGGLSDLSVWFVKLGITPERIEPGRPEQNGRHERMHRTLKQETAMPPKETMAAQQRAFDRFRHEYNEQRPHEALGQKPPAKVYRQSPQPFPAYLREPEYGPEFEVRRADDKGRFSKQGVRVMLAHCLRDELIGMRPVDEGRWELYYGPIKLGLWDETKAEPRVIRLR
jgi:transposase InsO family protein